MKVIDLLNLMVIGEDLPKRIRYEDEEYFLTDDKETYIGYICHSAIGRRHCLEQCLTDEIEIIEEPKKIENISDEELEQCDGDYDRICLILDRLDEIIDYINKGENNEK